MPANVGQLLFISVIQSVGMLGEQLIFPHKDLGRTRRSAPRGADPVIVVHGIADHAHGSRDIARALARDGFTVFTPTMPYNGLDGYEINARFLHAYVAWVLRTTGARKVDIIGHSQGGMSALAFARTGGHHVIDSYIALGSPLHGVGGFWRSVIDAVNGVGFLRWLAPRGLMQLDERDATMQALAAGADPTPGAATYISVRAADDDGIVVPGSSPILPGAENVILGGPVRRGGKRGPHHIAMNHDHAVYELVREKLLQSRHGWAGSS